MVEHLGKRCAAVSGRVIFIGFAIQIILGILWAGAAFAAAKNFGECLICLGQILLLCVAIWFAQGAKWAWRRLFWVLSVLTFPFVLHCLMSPDIRVFIAVFWLLGLGCVCRNGKYQRSLMVIFLVLGMLAGAVREPDTDFLMRLGSRMVWTTLYKEYERLPKETRDAIDYTELAESTYEATGIELVLLPSMERTMGKQESREVLWEMIALSWEYSKGRILKEIIWDEAGYLVTPLIVPMQFRGRAYESYSGLNYRQILQPAPRLGSFYVHYSCWWFGVALLLRCFLWLMERHQVAQSDKAVYVLFTVFPMSIWYTMSGAGKMDYKNTLYIMCIWMLWLVSGAVPELWEQKESKSFTGNNEAGEE